MHTFCMYFNLTQVQVEQYIYKKQKSNDTVKHTVSRFVMGDLMKQMHADTSSSLLMVSIFVTTKESTIEI